MANVVEERVTAEVAQADDVWSARFSPVSLLLALPCMIGWLGRDPTFVLEGRASGRDGRWSRQGLFGSDRRAREADETIALTCEP